MEDNGAPLWARELRDFTEFSLGRLEQRLTSRIDGLEGKIDGLDSRMTAFESRVIRKIDNMGAHFDEKFAAVRGASDRP